MPNKLRVVIGLYLISAVVDAAKLFTGRGGILDLILAAVVLYGLLRGNDGMRTFVIGCAWLNAAFACGFALLALVAGGAGAVDGVAAAMVLGLAAVAVAEAGFVMWVMSQDDVRTWMFRKNFGLDPAGGPPL
jgi:hypothetical protein